MEMLGLGNVNRFWLTFVLPLVTAHTLRGDAINLSRVMHCAEVKRSYEGERGKCYEGREKVKG